MQVKEDKDGRHPSVMLFGIRAFILNSRSGSQPGTYSCKMFETYSNSREGVPSYGAYPMGEFQANPNDIYIYIYIESTCEFLECSAVACGENGERKGARHMPLLKKKEEKNLKFMY